MLRAKPSASTTTSKRVAIRPERGRYVTRGALSTHHPLGQSLPRLFELRQHSAVEFHCWVHGNPNTVSHDTSSCTSYCGKMEWQAFVLISTQATKHGGITREKIPRSSLILHANGKSKEKGERQHTRHRKHMTWFSAKKPGAKIYLLAMFAKLSNTARTTLTTGGMGRFRLKSSHLLYSTQRNKKKNI